MIAPGRACLSVLSKQTEVPGSEVLACNGSEQAADGEEAAVTQRGGPGSAAGGEQSDGSERGQSRANQKGDAEWAEA